MLTGLVFARTAPCKAVLIVWHARAGLGRQLDVPRRKALLSRSRALEKTRPWTLWIHAGAVSIICRCFSVPRGGDALYGSAVRHRRAAFHGARASPGNSDRLVAVQGIAHVVARRLVGRVWLWQLARPSVPGPLRAFSTATCVRERPSTWHRAGAGQSVDGARGFRDYPAG